MGASLASNFTQTLSSEMDSDIVDESLERSTITSTIGLIGTIVSIALFQTIHQIFGKVLKPPKHISDIICVSKHSQGDNDGKVSIEYWKWKNLWISWFHAMVSGSWVLLK